MTTIEFLTSPVARALGWTLLHAVWQGFVLVLPTAVVLHLLRRRSSHLRYRLGALVLLGQLLASVATFVGCYQLLTATAVDSVTALTTLPGRWPVGLRSLTVQPLSWPQHLLLFLDAHLGEFVCLYLIGIALFGLRLAGGWLHLHQLRRPAMTIPLPMEQAVVDRLRVLLSIQPVVRVCASARVAGPVLIGALKPLLLLPVGLATGLSSRELEAILAHELAHVRRYDYAVNLLQSIIDVLYFFHPALWWLSARVREEREHCCDDLAVQVCGDNGRALAQALARVEAMRMTQLSLPALAMAFTGRRQLLLHRVQRVLGLSTRSMVSNRSLAGLTLATLLLLSVSVYAVQRVERSQQPKPKRTSQRRTTTDRTTELHFDSNRKLTTVVWKGQKLPASRVTALQQQWEQVMNGQVNLDALPQPDRDILLNVIESQYGKVSSAEQEKYAELAETAQQTIPLTIASAAEELAKVDYDSIVQGAISSDTPAQSSSIDTSDLKAIQEQLELLGKKMQAIIAERQPLVDQMSKELTALTQKHASTQKESHKLLQQQQQLAVQQSVLATKQMKLSRQLQPLQADIDRLSARSTKEAKSLLTQKLRQQEQLEKRMDELGTKMGEMGDVMGALGEKMESQISPYQQRMGILTDSISKLYEPTYALSEKMAELSGQLAEEANKQAEKAMEMANEAMKLNVNVPLNVTVPVRRPLSKSRNYQVIEGEVVAPAPPAPPAMAPSAKPARPAKPPRLVKGTATLSAPPTPSALSAPAKPARPLTPPKPLKGTAARPVPPVPPVKSGN